VFAGLPDAYESEGYDRTHMRLPECQNRLIEAVAEANPNTVVVLHNGAPVEMPWIGKVPAVLEAYLGGQAVGEAVVRILFGDANPSGRLPETFPLKLEDNPSYLYYLGEGNVTEYREGIFVGYRYYDRKKWRCCSRSATACLTHLSNTAA
jgi:Glycosyl hydrolase family 3 C terminal domain.